MDNNININELANELGLTRQVINRHILKGYAGEVHKAGDGKTHELLLTLENVLTLIQWLKNYGRGNRLKLAKVETKYKELSENQ